MKRTFLIFGLITATGVLFKTLVVANTVNQNTAYLMETIPTNSTDKVKLDATMVGLFTIGEELFFRDVYGNVGKATETNKERRMFTRSALPAQYEIVWENGMTSDYSTGIFYIREEGGEAEVAQIMPDFVEETVVTKVKN